MKGIRNLMKPHEKAAMDGMITAARDRRKGGLVKLALWQEEIKVNGLAAKAPVWLCGWMRDPDTKNEGTTLVGWRHTEAEMSALCVECTAYFDRAIRPPHVVLHGPHGTERLRG